MDRTEMVKILSNTKVKCSNAIRLYVMPYKLEYLFGGFFVLVILLSEMYFDFFATFRHGINFWHG